MRALEFIGVLECACVFFLLLGYELPRVVVVAAVVKSVSGLECPRYY